MAGAAGQFRKFKRRVVVEFHIRVGESYYCSSCAQDVSHKHQTDFIPLTLEPSCCACDCVRPGADHLAIKVDYGVLSEDTCNIYSLGSDTERDRL